MGRYNSPCAFVCLLRSAGSYLGGSASKKARRSFASQRATAKLRHWSFLAKASVHTKRRVAPFFVVCLVLIMAMTVVAFCSVGQAQGSKQEDSSTLGLGSSRAQAVDTQQLSSAQRASGVTDASSSVDGVTVTEAADATEATQRSITVKDPDPVVVPVAVDETNALAKQKANEVCTLDPLPTAPRVAPDVNDGTWQSGVASAYSIEIQRRWSRQLRCNQHCFGHCAHASERYGCRSRRQVLSGW